MVLDVPHLVLPLAFTGRQELHDSRKQRSECHHVLTDGFHAARTQWVQSNRGYEGYTKMVADF